MDSLKAALDTIQTLKKCECPETRKSLVAVLENHVRTSIKRVHDLLDRLEKDEERLLKIVGIAKDHDTDLDVSKDFASRNFDDDL